MRLSLILVLLTLAAMARAETETPKPTPPPEPRKLDSLITTSWSGWGAVGPRWHAGLSLGAGFDYLSPAVHAQVRVNDKVSFGVMPLYSVSNVNSIPMRAAGGFVTTAYHVNRDAFLGLIGQLGLGYYALSGANSAPGSSLAISTLIGWRGYAPLGFTLFFGMGGQQAFRLSGDPAQVDFSGIRPYAALELGVPF